MENVNQAKSNYDKGMCDFLDLPEDKCQRTGDEWKKGLEDHFSGQ